MRAVYIGGFGSGRSSAEKVGNALQSHFDEVEAYTFSDFVRNPVEPQLAMWKAELITHSAGALAIADHSSLPKFAHLINPPLPRTILSLLARTVVKQTRMSMPGLGVYTDSDMGAALDFTASSAAELAVHPIANLGNLPKISDFDAIDEAAQANVNSERKWSWSGWRTRIVWTDQCAYFKPSEADLERARAYGLQVDIVPGEHDELILRPEQFLTSVFQEAQTEDVLVEPGLPDVQCG